MVECPMYEGQGLIRKVRVKDYIFYICDECDSCWESKEEIYNVRFQYLREFHLLKEISFEDADCRIFGSYLKMLGSYCKWCTINYSGE